MIQRRGGAIRVERSEGLMWLETLGTAVVAPLILTWSFVAAATEPGTT